MSSTPNSSHIPLTRTSRGFSTSDDTKEPSSNHGSTLYPPIEPGIAPLDEGSHYYDLVKVEKELVKYIKDSVLNGNPLDDVADTSILPSELLLSATAQMTKKSSIKTKLDPLKRLKELSVNNDEENEDEEVDEEEDEDEEQQVVEDEEDDAGGDYIVSHFDNGEGFDDNDDEGDESMM